MRTLVIDFETYYDSEYSLSKMTTQDYITDPRFEVLMASYILDDSYCVVLDGHEIAPFLSALDPENTVVVNHNAAFDATILSVRYGFHPKMIVDTMSLARAAGAHIAAGGASLDALATCLREQGIDIPAKGNAVHDAKGKRRKDFSPEYWAVYREYCKTDTIITNELLKQLAPYFYDNPTEITFQDLIMKCMARPLLAIDKPLVQEELAYVRNRRAGMLQSLADQLNVPIQGLSTQLRSNERMAAMYRHFGGYEAHLHGAKDGSEEDEKYQSELQITDPEAFTIPQKVSKTTGKWTYAFGKTDAPMLALLEHPNPDIVALTETRLGTKSSIDETRCERFLKLADAGFLCMPYLICGAHTGRMAGRDKFNVQNLPSGRTKGQTNNLRRSIIPRYQNQVCVVVDSSQIECVAGDGMVLTDSGLKRIDTISTSDLLWDGVEWVSHSGIVCRGTKDVIEYEGIVGTPDHIVFTQDGRKLSLDEAAATKAPLLIGERDGKAIRQVDSTEPTNTVGLESTYVARSEIDLSRADDRAGCKLCQKESILPDNGSRFGLHLKSLLSCVFKWKSKTGTFITRNKPKYSAWGNPIIRTIPVYDIINAGPRNRFCYNGLIISNCRASSYAANNQPDLDAFAEGKDIYSVMAANLYGEPYDVIRKGVKVDHDPHYIKLRQVAKAAVLSCQFGTGAKAFRAYAKVVGGVALSESEAKGIVDGYRETNWRVVDMWKQTEWAMRQMIAGERGYFGGPNCDLFFFDGSRHVFGKRIPGIRLPSGLWINYRGLATEPGQWPDGSPKFDFYFYHGSGKRVEKKYTYMSKVYENLVQGLAFQVMAHQAVRIAERYPIAMNVHDEWVCVVPEAEADDCLAYMIACMSEAPDWVVGLPLGAEGSISYRYGDAK